METNKSNSYLSFFIEFLEYVFVFLIIIECNSLFVNSVENGSDNIEKYLNKIGYVISFLLCCYYFIKLKCKRIFFERSFPIVFFILIYAIFFYFVNVRFTRFVKNEYITHFLLFLPLICILLKLKRFHSETFDLFLKFSDIVCVLSFFSIIFYLSYTLYPENSLYDVLRTRWSGLGEVREINNYFNFCVLSPYDTRTFGDFTITRNYGWYPESPMFCIALVSSLFSELFFRNKVSFFRIFLLVITVFSSQATLGMILAVIGISLKLLDSYRSFLSTKLIVTIVSVSLFLCVLLFLNKMSTGTDTLSSYSVHIDDYRVSILAFLERPIVGWGYNSVGYIHNFMSSERLTSNIGLSNSVAVILAEGGIILGSFCMLPYAICLIQIFNKNYKAIGLWSVGMFGLYCLMIFHFHLYFIMLIAFGYSLLDSKIFLKERKFSIFIGELGIHHEYKHTNLTSCNSICKYFEYIKYLAVVFFVLLFLSSSYCRQFLYSFLFSYNLLLGASVWRPLALIIVCIYFAVLVKKIFFSENKYSFDLWLWRIVRFILCIFVFCLFYNQIYSYIINNFISSRIFSDAKVTILLFGTLVFIITIVESLILLKNCIKQRQIYKN